MTHNGCYTPGSTRHPEAPSNMERRADQELYESLRGARVLRRQSPPGRGRVSVPTGYFSWGLILRCPGWIGGN